MQINTLITPVSYRQISNLHFTKYMFIYVDSEKKLKRAIPDFRENYLDIKDSLIDEAMASEKIGIFRVLSKGEEKSKYLFSINIDEEGNIVKSDNISNEGVKLENMLNGMCFETKSLKKNR